MVQTGSHHRYYLKLIYDAILDQGPSVLEVDEEKKGLLPRVVDGIFEHIKSFDEMSKYSIKLSMVSRNTFLYPVLGIALTIICQ